MRSRFATPSFRAAVALVLGFGLLGAVYSVVTPPWEAPDEVGHFEFITTLLKNHALPVQRVGDLGEAHQTPLYYAIAALVAAPVTLDDPTGAFQPNARFMWAGQGGQEVNAGLHGSAETFPFHSVALAMHLARFTSVVLGMITVAFTVAIGWEIFPEQRLIGLLAGALVAFNPQFLFISGAVNNDNLLTTASTGAWWQILRSIRTPGQARQWVYVGVWTSVGILAKPNGAVIAVAAFLALVIASRRHSSVAIFLKGAMSVGAVAGVTCGWWFIRNLVLYGDVLGWTVYQQVYAANLRHTPLTLADLREFAVVQLHSFWGVFGWMNVYPPSWYDLAASVLGLAGLLGFVVFCFRQFARQSSYQKVAIGILAAVVVVEEFSLLVLITHADSSGYQGRYLFPAIAPAMLILSIGITSLLSRRLGRVGSGVLALAMVGVAAFVPFRVIQPAYHLVPLPKSSLWFAPNKSDIVVGETFALRGYAVSSDKDGVHFRVMLYWQALKPSNFDYSVFVHVIDDRGTIVAQKDQAPGASARYPPTSWLPGDIVADEHTIESPSDLPPGTYRFRVGIYNWLTGQQLPVQVTGQPSESFIILDSVVHR